MDTICLKCQILFSEKNNKRINLSFAEFAQGVGKVNSRQLQGTISLLTEFFLYFSLFLHENICYGYSLEVAQCVPSNEKLLMSTHNIFFVEKYKKYCSE